MRGWTMPNEKELDRLLTAAWQRMAFSRERFENTGRPDDYEVWRCNCAYVDALEDARQVYRGFALPKWVELVRLEMIRRYDEDAGVTDADPT